MRYLGQSFLNVCMIPLDKRIINLFSRTRTEWRTKCFKHKSNSIVSFMGLSKGNVCYANHLRMQTMETPIWTTGSRSGGGGVGGGICKSVIT